MGVRDADPLHAGHDRESDDRSADDRPYRHTREAHTRRAPLPHRREERIVRTESRSRSRPAHRDEKFDDPGMPSLLQIAVMIPESANVIRPASPPRVVRRAASVVLGPIARTRGYRGVQAPEPALALQLQERPDRTDRILGHCWRSTSLGRRTDRSAFSRRPTGSMKPCGSGSPARRCSECSGCRTVGLPASDQSRIRKEIARDDSRFEHAVERTVSRPGALRFADRTSHERGGDPPHAIGRFSRSMRSCGRPAVCFMRRSCASEQTRRRASRKGTSIASASSTP